MSNSSASPAERNARVVVTTDHSPDVEVPIETGDRVVFRLPLLILFAIALFTVALFVVAGPWMLGEQITDGIDASDGWQWVGWVLFLIPLAAALWFLRVRTEVDGAGVVAVSYLSSQRVAWSDIAGIRIGRRGAVFADRLDGSEVRLPAIGFSQLPRLSAASGGRIPALD